MHLWIAAHINEQMLDSKRYTYIVTNTHKHAHTKTRFCFSLLSLCLLHSFTNSLCLLPFLLGVQHALLLRILHRTETLSICPPAISFTPSLPLSLPPSQPLSPPPPLLPSFLSFSGVETLWSHTTQEISLDRARFFRPEHHYSLIIKRPFESRKGSMSLDK